MFIGWLGLGLMLWGVATHWRTQSIWLKTGLLFLWLMLGDRAPISLWRVLHALPVYDSMRVAQRFRVAGMLSGAVMAGFGAMHLFTLVRRKTGAWPVVSVLAVLAWEILSVNQKVFTHAFPLAPPVVARQPAFEQISALPAGRWGRDAMYPALLQNQGTVDCYETAEVPRRPVPKDAPGYRGEVFLEATGGVAAFSRWTPNEWTMAVHADGNGAVVVNQNYYRGWETRDGRSVIANARGLISVPVTSQDGTIELYYRPPMFVPGAIVSLATATLGALWMGRLKRRGRG
jgi:hypothetical protein